MLQSAIIYYALSKDTWCFSTKKKSSDLPAWYTTDKAERYIIL